MIKNIFFKDYLLLALLFLTEFTRGAFFLTFLPFYAINHLGLSIALAGFAASAHYLTETVFKAAAGWQLDRSGRLIMYGGMLLSLASLIILRFYLSPAVLLITSALFGLGVSPIWLAVISEVAPVDREDRAGRFGLVFAAWLTGAGSGPVMINFVLNLGYDLTFVILIGIWILALAVALILPAPVKKPTQDKTPFSSVLFRMTSDKALTRILLPGMFLQTLSASLLLPVLPLYAQKMLGLNQNQYGYLLLVGGAAAVVFFLPMGRLADRLPVKKLLSVGFGMTALSLAMFTAAQKPLAAFSLAALTGFSYAVVLPAWNTLLACVIPAEKQATGWGLFSTIEGLGISLGPALGGIVAKSLGPTAAIFTSTAILFLMALFYLLYPIEKFFIKQ